MRQVLGMGKDPVQDARLLSKLLVCMGIFSVVMACVVVGRYVYFFSGDISAEQEVWGQFGDYVGGILNPLISLVALIALIATFRVQVQELQMSSQELKNSADALKAQNESLAKQGVESTFFELLKLHNEIVHNMRWGFSNKEGREVLQARLQGFVDALKRELNDFDFGRFEEIYEKWFKNSEGNLGPYFRRLYTLVTLIDQTEHIKEADKQFYINMIQSQLSSWELELLFYNSLSSRGENFKPLVEKYALLEHMPLKDSVLDSLLHGPALRSKYNPSAFGDASSEAHDAAEA